MKQLNVTIDVIWAQTENEFDWAETFLTENYSQWQKSPNWLDTMSDGITK